VRAEMAANAAMQTDTDTLALRWLRHGTASTIFTADDAIQSILKSNQPHHAGYAQTIPNLMQGILDVTERRRVIADGWLARASGGPPVLTHNQQ